MILVLFVKKLQIVLFNFLCNSLQCAPGNSSR